MDSAEAESLHNAGLLLIGHGSRDPLGTAQFFQMAESLRQFVASRGISIPVEASLLEFQTPTIEQGWRGLVERGVEHIFVAPLLLFSAGHAREDIPAEIKRCAAQSPGVTWSLGRPLSRHRGVVELLYERIAQAWALGSGQLPSADRPSGLDPFRLIMVGRGSRHPCATSDMLVLSEIVRWRLGLRSVKTAFYAMAAPRLTDVLEALVTAEPASQFVVCPHLLFDGRLYQAIRAQVDELARLAPQHCFHVTRYLGPELRIAQAICDRTFDQPVAQQPKRSARRPQNAGG